MNIATNTASGTKSDHVTDTAARAEIWMEKIGDFANPILVKETRQSLKSRYFVISFLALLAAAWIITVFGVLMSGQLIQYGAPASGFFFMYYMVLVIATQLVVPFGAYRSLLNEREQHTFDLLSITDLKPGQIVRGKLQSSLVQTLIFYSALAPFIAFTALLGGFDFVIVSIVMTATLLISAANSTLGLMVSTLGKQRQMQTLNSLGFLGLLVWQLGVYLTMVGSMMSQVIPISNPEFWWSVVVVITIGTSYVILAYQVATAQLTFETDNRSTGIRITCAVQFFLLVIGVFCIFAFSGTGGSLDDALETLLVLGAIHWAVVGLIVATEPNYISYRIRRNLPTRRLWRLLAAPFLPGGSRGLLYFLIHLTLLWAIICGTSSLLLSSSTFGRLSSFATVTCAYIVIYTCMAAWMSRIGGELTSEFRPAHARVCTLVIFAIGMIVPYIPIMAGYSNWRDVSILHLTNPFDIIIRVQGSPSNMSWAVAFVGITALLGIVLNSRTMIRSVSEVVRTAVRQPHEAGAIPESAPHEEATAASPA